MAQAYDLSIEWAPFFRLCLACGRRSIRTLGAVSRSPRSEIAAMWVAAATALVLGLAGCAAEPGPRANSSPPVAAPYVGVFTGEFVDGKPLYRFPAILVIGSRSSVGPGI